MDGAETEAAVPGDELPPGDEAPPGAATDVTKVCFAVLVVIL